VKAPKEAPNTKSQAPVKLQKPIFKCCTRGLSTFCKFRDFTEALLARAKRVPFNQTKGITIALWCLRFGVSLVFGAWNLELRVGAWDLELFILRRSGPGISAHRGSNSTHRCTCVAISFVCPTHDRRCNRFHRQDREQSNCGRDR